ncbi:serine/threonine-protein kinase [Streptomyces sioyaensis]|uniref:serine/threonine-protein kinase n=1 Tax=Streptomyces sioyaensis TaxID=67364 RepID=UPI003D72C781
MAEQLVLAGRYRLESRVEGGVAVLWKARDLVKDRWVAVKMLRDRGDLARRHDVQDLDALDHELIARFRRECGILREIQHRAIPAWFGQGFHGGRPYLVMEWVDGVSLREFIRTYGALESSVVAAIVVQIADALACAHRHGFIHRDLNPNNIVIAGDGTVHMVDFGIALPLAPDSTRYTAYGRRSPGTPGFTSPEQLRGGAVGVGSDIYSFGCVAFELHTGRWPFLADADGGLDHQHVSDKPAPAVAADSPGVPVILAETVDRMLAKRVEDRPGSVEKVRTLYHPFLPGPGAPEPRPRLVPDPTRPFREPQQAKSGPSTPRRGASRPRASHRHTPLPRLGDAESALTAALHELDTESPGPHCEHLARLLPDALRAWGIRSKITARIQLACADSAFFSAENDADTRGALTLYQELVTELDEHAAPDIREVFLSARVGVAHCLLAVLPDPVPAFDGWASVTGETANLPAPPSEAVRRCRVLGEEFVEAGIRADRAVELLALLPTAAAGDR